MDLFVEQNFLMNLIVLSLTQIFCNPNGKKNYIRMILAAFLGAVLSVCVLVIGSFYVYVAVAAIILVPFMLVIAFGRQNGRQMIRFMLVSWLSIVIVNGIVSIGCQWTGTQGIPWYLAILTLCIARILVRNLVNNLQRQTKFVKSLSAASSTVSERTLLRLFPASTDLHTFRQSSTTTQVSLRWFVKSPTATVRVQR